MFNFATVMNRIRLVKNIRIVSETNEPDLKALQATGIAELEHLLTPALVKAKDYEKPPEDGIYELDFVLGNTTGEPVNVEMEVNVVFKLKEMPAWVKGIKVNARENSDIELLI
jgi:hypothetical protein